MLLQINRIIKSSLGRQRQDCRLRQSWARQAVGFMGGGKGGAKKIKER